MRIINIALALIGSALPVMAATTEAESTANAGKLSLDDCIAIALSENPTIKVADMEIERYDYSKKETLGQLLPSISFGATYNRMIAKQVTYLNMDAFGGMGGMGGGTDTDNTDADAGNASRKGSDKDNGIKMGLDNSFQVGFSASVPLIAPQLWKTLKISDSRILESVETARQSRLQLVNQVKSAYYRLLLAEDSHRVIQESLDMAKFTASIYEKKQSAGAASEYDVLRTRVAVKNVEPELLQSEIAIKQAKLQLLILMGMKPGTTFEASDSLQRYEKDMYANALSLDRNISDNTDLRLFDIRTRQLQQALDVKKAAWYPTLALTASYNWTSSSDGSPFANFRWNPFSVVGLTLQLPLFTGGQRYYGIKQAEIQAGEMDWQRENLTRSINMQVDLAIDNINKNIEQISSSRESVAQAVKAHDIMQRSFEIGAASYLDLRDSELALTRSQLSYYEAIYNYLVANNELELLLGNADLTKYTPAK